MNHFKSIRVISEAAADEYVLEDDDSEEELAPRADGEAEFVDLHTAVSIAHPVADDNQFKSQKDQAVTKNAQSDNAGGEDKPVNQGTSGDTKFAQFRDKIGKTPARKGDKSQGDIKAETVKEEVTEAMDDKKFAYKKGVSDAKKGKKRANASDVYGPHAKEYHKGYDSVKEEVELDEKLKYEGKFKKGDTIKAFDFERKKDHYISGKITGTEVRNGAKVYVIKVTNDSGKTSGGRVGNIGYVPMETSMDYDGRIVKEGVELDEAVKACMIKLKDGKSVKVSPDEAKMFNTVLKELNPENRKRMEVEMMKDQKSYKEMLTFAKRTG